MLVFLGIKAVAGRFLTPTFDAVAAASCSGLMYFVETFLVGLLNFALPFDFKVAVDWRLPMLNGLDLLSLLDDSFVIAAFFTFGASFRARAAWAASKSIGVFPVLA